MSYPPVSVIIPHSPAHTPASMLDEAIESVESQSVNTEVIMVTDDEQRGPAWARNRGLERADTRFVAFLDADDLWKRGKLSRQLDEIADTEAAICVEGRERTTREFVRDIYLGRIESLTSSILLDTERTSVRFEERLERREDHLFILEAATDGGVCFCEDIVTIRKQPDGLSAQNEPDIRVRANERFAELFAERVSADVADAHSDEFFHILYHGVGRSAHKKREFGRAIGYFRRALSHRFSPRTLAAMALSTLLWPTTVFDSKTG
jgi:glycosyltransferase involved in cell wall biosynthesis